jgi:ADP-ribose pyrophosphatase YjhB (NUDIX family)
LPSLGASAVIVEDGRILLIKREDFKVWALPGGTVESGETTAQAAIREVKEETGLDVELSRLVGIYSSPRWHDGGDHVLSYEGKALSTELVKQSEETVDADFFDANNLPEPLVWWHRRRISDALSGITGVACLQDRVWPLGDISRQDLYEAVRESGMSKAEFYTEHFSRPENETDEVKGIRLKTTSVNRA